MENSRNLLSKWTDIKGEIFDRSHLIPCVNEVDSDIPVKVIFQGYIHTPIGYFYLILKLTTRALGAVKPLGNHSMVCSLIN